MRYFFIEPSEISGKLAVISGMDAKHIKNVLHLKTGDKIGLFDGKGYEYESRITQFLSNTVEVAISRKHRTLTESPVKITIAQAFLKEKKMDALIRQLTELGITAWLPFFSKRSIPQPNEARLATRVQRWDKIAKQSIKQCKRGLVPQISPPASFENLLDAAKGYDLKIVFWENATALMNSSITEKMDNPEKILLLLGPEGGFSEAEIEQTNSAGFIPFSLGPRILRAETAPIAACSIIQYVLGDMGEK
jgi:16S rRNA (uracil1498-N3)-methyltransferase